MAINRPITKTIISTTAWGIPITDEVNRIASLTDGRTPTVLTTATLKNGWTQMSGNPIQYRKSGDLVQIRGRANHANGVAWQAIFTLPAGFTWPNTDSGSFAVTGVNAGAWGTSVIQIASDGNVVPAVNGNTAFSFTLSFSTTP